MSISLLQFAQVLCNFLPALLSGRGTFLCISILNAHVSRTRTLPRIYFRHPICSPLSFEHFYIRCMQSLQERVVARKFWLLFSYMVEILEATRVFDLRISRELPKR